MLELSEYWTYVVVLWTEVASQRTGSQVWYYQYTKGKGIQQSVDLTGELNCWNILWKWWKESLNTEFNKIQWAIKRLCVCVLCVVVIWCSYEIFWVRNIAVACEMEPLVFCHLWHDDISKSCYSYLKYLWKRDGFTQTQSTSSKNWMTFDHESCSLFPSFHFCSANSPSKTKMLLYAVFLQDGLCCACLVLCQLWHVGVLIQYGKKQGHRHDCISQCHLVLCSLYLWCSSWWLQLWGHQWLTPEACSLFHQADFLFSRKHYSERLQTLHDWVYAVGKGKQH